MDDEEVVRNFLRKMLLNLRQQVIMVADGREAVALLEESHRLGIRVELAIVDLAIPAGMGGKEALAQLWRIYPSLPVVVVSGYSNNPDMASCRQIGFNATSPSPLSSISCKTGICPDKKTSHYSMID